MGIFDFIKAKNEKPKLWEGGGFNSWLQAGQAVDDITASLRSWSFACIQKRADAIAGLEWEITTNGKTPKAGYWLTLLFQNPSVRNTRYEVLEYVSKSLDLYGNAYLWTPKGSGNVPISIEIIPAQLVQIIVENGYVSRYRVQFGASQRDLFPDEICHIRTLNPRGTTESLYIGDALINSAIDAIRADAEITAYIKNYFRSDALPPLVFVTDDQITAEQGERLRKLWNDKFPDHMIAGFLEDGMDIKPITSGGVGAGNSLNVTQLDSDTLSKIAAVFGIPKGKITGEHQNKATADVNDYSFRVDTIEPFAKRIEEQLTQHFRQFDKSVAITHKRYVYSDEATEASRMQFELSNGLKTVNELRAEKGYPAVKDGNTLYIPQGLQPLGAIVPTTQPLESVKKKSWNESEIEAYWKSWDIHAKGFEQDLEDALRKGLGELETEVADYIEDRGVYSDSSLFDVTKVEAEFAKIAEPILTAEITASMRKAIKELGDNWNGTESDFDRQIKKLLQFSLDKIKKGVQTIDGELKELLRANKDESIDTLKKLISERFGNIYTKSRVVAIAETTSGYAVNSAQKMVYSSVKGVKSVWTSQRDGKVRGNHKGADGQTEDGEGMFTVGGEKLPHPCGGNIAGNNINCRCYLRPRIK